MGKLFHDSNIEIDKIDLTKNQDFKDFGRGFCFTELEQQAIQ
jgi:hypothetical protein